MNKNNHLFFCNIHKSGYLYVIGMIVISCVLFALSWNIGFISLLLTGMCAYFFRDPNRVISLDPSLVLSPADGKICAIDIREMPTSLATTDEKVVCISIFLSIINVHVNRIPINSTVKGLNYCAGQFINASLKASRTKNERQEILLQTPDGIQIVVVQIAGMIARKIVCDLTEDQEVTAGQRFGIIKFGSRVDIYLPPQVTTKVAVGQTVIAGETILANLKENTQQEFKTI